MVLIIIVLVVIITLAAAVVDSTWLFVTGGLGLSVNFLGGGLVGFSFVSSRVTEKAQRSDEQLYSQSC